MKPVIRQSYQPCLTLYTLKSKLIGTATYIFRAFWTTTVNREGIILTTGGCFYGDTLGGMVCHIAKSDRIHWFPSLVLIPSFGPQIFYQVIFFKNIHNQGSLLRHLVYLYTVLNKVLSTKRFWYIDKINVATAVLDYGNKKITWWTICGSNDGIRRRINVSYDLWQYDTPYGMAAEWLHKWNWSIPKFEKFVVIWKLLRYLPSMTL